MKQIKAKFTSVVLMAAILFTITARATVFAANDCSATSGGPFNLDSSHCDGTNVTCCFLKAGGTAKGIYN